MQVQLLALSQTPRESWEQGADLSVPVFPICKVGIISFFCLSYIMMMMMMICFDQVE